MSVYIDPETHCIPNGKYRWDTVTHLFADTEDELHRFASMIGMKREWFQNKESLKHYDLNSNRRRMAIKAGAIQLNRKDAVMKWRELRK